MNQKVITMLPRLFADSPRRTHVPPPLPWSRSPLPALQHPALSYPAEEVSIHLSLDLSFRQNVAVSHLDRQIIDNLTASRHL